MPVSHACKKNGIPDRSRSSAEYPDFFKLVMIPVMDDGPVLHLMFSRKMT